MTASERAIAVVRLTERRAAGKLSAKPAPGAGLETASETASEMTQLASVPA
jgi:hypothetical protein